MEPLESDPSATGRSDEPEVIINGEEDNSDDDGDGGLRRAVERCPEMG